MTLGPIRVLTLSRARKAAQAALAAVCLGRDPAGEKLEDRQKAAVTFGSLLPGYLKFKQAETKPRSFLEIDRHLSMHAKPLHPVAIERPDLRRLAATRLIELGEQNGQGVASGVRASVSAYGTWLVQTGILEASPFANLVGA
jgi:hypothetical protein